MIWLSISEERLPEVRVALGEACDRLEERPPPVEQKGTKFVNAYICDSGNGVRLFVVCQKDPLFRDVLVNVRSTSGFIRSIILHKRITQFQMKVASALRNHGATDPKRK
jgi:hypothetical protein